MDEKQKAQYEKTKKYINSLVVSSPHPLLVRDIRREYEEAIGSRLPYVELGFRSPEDLYRSMTDIVRIEPGYQGDVLRAVIRPETAHIVQYVRGQKKDSSKSKRNRPRNTFGNYNNFGFNNAPHRPPIFPQPLMPIPCVRPCLGHSPFVLHNPVFNLVPLQPKPYIHPLPSVVNRQQPNSGSCVTNGQQFHGQPVSYSANIQQPNSGSYSANTQQSHSRPGPYPANWATWQQPNPGPCAAANRQQSLPTSFAATGQQPRPVQPISDRFKNCLKEVVAGHPNGLTFSKLQNELQCKCSYHLNPLMMGYSRWEDFIATVPEIARLQMTGIGMVICPVNDSTNRVDRSEKVSTKHEQTKSDVANANNHVAKTLSENKENELSIDDDENALSVISEESSKYEIEKFERDLSPSNIGSSYWDRSDDRSELSQYDVESYHEVPSERVDSLSDDIENLYQEASDEEEYKANKSGISSKINPRMKSDLKKIMNMHPEGLPIYELLAEYEKFTGHKLNLRDYGFTSVDELVYNVPDVFHVEDGGRTGGSILYSVDNPPTKKVEPQAEAKREPKKKDLPRVSNDVLKKMLEVFVDVTGVSINQFPGLYMLIHNEPFEIDDASCISLKELFLKLNNFFELKNSKTGDIWVNYTEYGRDLLNSWSKPTLDYQSKEMPKSVPPLKVPDDAVTSYEAGPHYSKEYDFRIGDCYKVQVCCVYGPDKFWIQLHENAQVLDDLTYDMADTYNDSSKSEFYAIHPSMIKCNLPCVVYICELKEWNRGLITSVEGGDVEVELCDYGNSVEVHITQLKYLRRKFAEVPISCWRAKLANVEGTFTGKWTDGAKRRFSNLTLDHSFTARIVDNVAALSVELLNQSMNVGELLCSERHGILIKRKDLNQNSSAGREFRILSDDHRNSMSASKEAHSSQQRDTTLTSRQHLSRCTDQMSQLNLGAQRPDYYSHVNNSQVRNSDASRKLSSAQLSRPVKAPGRSLHVSNQSDNVPMAGRANRSPDSSIRIMPMKIVTKNDIHVVRLPGTKTSYIPTFEISRFFWSVDMLKQFTKAVQPDVEYLTIRPSDRPSLFEELLKECDDPPTNVMDLIPVKVLPIVLPKILKHDHDIMNDITSLADIFS